MAAENQTVYAIISDGAHQYHVEEGQTIEVERKNLPEGADKVEFDRVLFIGGLEDGPKIGRPVVEGAKVTASLRGEVKGKKITIQKMRRRKNSRVTQGHRQKYLRLEVEKIEF